MLFKKQQKGGFGSQPNTPKIPKLLLPESPGGQNFAPLRAQSPWQVASPQPVIARPASTRPFVQRTETPEYPSGTPPLKSCLKQRQRTMTMTGDVSAAAREISKLRESDLYSPVKPSPMTRERKFSMTGGGTPPVKPKKVTPPPTCTVPMKPPHLPLVNLHWQLLPHNSNPRCFDKPRVQFDISTPISSMRFLTATYPRPLRNSDLDKLVADEPLDEMTIECEKLPKGLVRIRRHRPITCRDVFEEIYKAYNSVLSDIECRREVPSPRSPQFLRINAAFKSRCALSPGLIEYEECQGFRRVDLLEGKTVFLGLTQPKPSANWVLQLGYPQH